MKSDQPVNFQFPISKFAHKSSVILDAQGLSVSISSTHSLICGRLASASSVTHHGGHHTWHPVKVYLWSPESAHPKNCETGLACRYLLGLGHGDVVVP